MEHIHHANARRLLYGDRSRTIPKRSNGQELKSFLFKTGAVLKGCF